MFDFISEAALEEINEVHRKHNLPIMRAEDFNLIRGGRQLGYAKTSVSWKNGKPFEIEESIKTIRLEQ